MPFPSYQPSPSDRPRAVKGAKRRSGPLTARTDLESFRVRGRVDPCFDPRLQGGFWTEGESASRRALRSNLNPLPEDTAHAALCYAGLCKEEELDRRHRSSKLKTWGSGVSRPPGA